MTSYRSPAYQPRQSPIDLSVIIPMFETREETQPAVYGLATAIQRDTAIRTEIILVANGVECERFARTALHRQGAPKRKWIVNAMNVGVGAAWNAAADMAEGKVLLFLNDDLDVCSRPATATAVETIKRMYEVMRTRPDVGVVGIEGHNFSWNGPPPIDHPNPRCFVGRGSYGINPKYPHWETPPECGIETDVVTGAVFMVRLDDLYAVGKFDPRYYPFFAEEYDLAYAVREKLGKKVLTIPGLIEHRVGISNRPEGVRSGGGAFYLTGYVERDPQIIEANWRFHRKWHPQSPERMK